jgi:hypothetical protein
MTLPPIATPGGASGSVVLVVGSGAQAGTYNLTGDPACAYGVIADDTWSAQYGNFSAGDGEVSTIQVTDEPDSTGNGKQRIVSAFIVIGPIFGGTNYSLSLDRFSGNFTREVQDNTDTAVIHIAGKTTESPLGPGNVPIDITINCPTVNRG